MSVLERELYQLGKTVRSGTIITVILIGAGVLFIASSLDNTPILATFQKLISGQQIDWTGGSSSSNTATTQRHIIEQVIGANGKTCTLYSGNTSDETVAFCNCLYGANTTNANNCIKTTTLNQ